MSNWLQVNKLYEIELIKRANFHLAIFSASHLLLHAVSTRPLQQAANRQREPQGGPQTFPGDDDLHFLHVFIVVNFMIVWAGMLLDNVCF